MTKRSGQFLQRVPLTEARKRLLASVVPVGDEEIAVDDAAGRVAATTVVARRPSPHYRASAMDGLAVRADDTRSATAAGLWLKILPPDAPQPAAGDPCCVVVDTGSLLPAWTDAVVRIEQAASEGHGFRIREAVAAGRDVRREGEDVDAGTVLLRSGDRIRPWDVGAMLATGTTRVLVRRRPRVAILATGSEVVEPDVEAGPGRVIDYNSRILAALACEWGATPHRLGIAADDRAELEAAIADACSRFDAVCVIAGSSAGRKDFTIDAVAALGDILVHGVDIAPGRPVALARVARAGASATPVLAVPGYPVSAIVVCERLLQPLVAALLGAAEVPPVRHRARLARAMMSRLGVEEFRRVCLVRESNDGFVVAALPSGAGSISSVAEAHAWLRIAPEVEGLDAGAEVEVELTVALEEIAAACVLAGPPSAASAALGDKMRRDGWHGRMSHLRLAPADAVASLRRGEAHAVLLDPADVDGAGPGLQVREVEGTGMLLATLAPRSDRGGQDPGPGS